MNIKENDQIPNSEVFVMENGDPIKKNAQELLLKVYTIFIAII